MTDVYIGVDVGSVSTNIAVTDDSNRVLASSYIRTHGRPIEAVQKGLREIAGEVDSNEQNRFHWRRHSMTRVVPTAP